MALHRTENVTVGPGHQRQITVVSASVLCGATKDAVTGLKYRNERGNAIRLAALLVLLVPPGTHAITWAPTAEERRIRRGIDHAELIARHLGSFTGIPTKRLLRRVGSSRQTGRTGAERRNGPEFVASRSCRGLRVVVVDDVVTTGSTVVAACTELLRAGAATADALTVAAVP